MKSAASSRSRSHSPLIMVNSLRSANSNHSFVVPEQEETQHGVVRNSGAYAAVSANKPKMVLVGVPVPEIQEISKKQEQWQFHYTQKFSLKVEVVDETALIETPPLNGNSKFNTNRGQEIKKEEKKKKPPKRRGAKAMKEQENAEEGIAAVEKKRAVLAYPRAEIESLRFENLEDQMKKWEQVYRGLGARVAHEYDGLVNSAHLLCKRNSLAREIC